MIKYSLKCTSKNCDTQPFDGWFKSIDSFESQIKSGFLTCPMCGSSEIKKNLMAPSINTSKKHFRKNELNNTDLLSKDGPNQTKQSYNSNEIFSILRKIKKEIQKTGEYVGNKFSEEARSIHKGDAKNRTIYGNASKEEIEQLEDEGINITSIPWIQDDH